MKYYYLQQRKYDEMCSKEIRIAGRNTQGVE